MTKKSRMRESVAVISSTTASAKYAWSASPERLSNGSTTTDGRLDGIQHRIKKVRIHRSKDRPIERDREGRRRYSSPDTTTSPASAAHLARRSSVDAHQPKEISMPSQHSSNPGRGESGSDSKQTPRQDQDRDKGQDETDKGSGTHKGANRGHFAKDPDRAREAGHKGGQSR